QEVIGGHRLVHSASQATFVSSIIPVVFFQSAARANGCINLFGFPARVNIFRKTRNRAAFLGGFDRGEASLRWMLRCPSKRRGSGAAKWASVDLLMSAQTPISETCARHSFLPMLCFVATPVVDDPRPPGPAARE